MLSEEAKARFDQSFEAVKDDEKTLAKMREVGPAYLVNMLIAEGFIRGEWEHAKELIECRKEAEQYLAGQLGMT